MYAPGFGFGKDGAAIVVVIIVVYVVFSAAKGYISARKTRKKWKEIHAKDEIILKEIFDEMDQRRQHEIGRSRQGKRKVEATSFADGYKYTLFTGGDIYYKVLKIT